MLNTSVQSEYVSDGRNRTSQTIHVVVEQRYLAQEQPSGMLRALQDRLANVSLHNADITAFSANRLPFLSSDVVIGRGRNWPVFTALRAAELAGATVINSAAAIASVYDKSRMAIELSAAGIPTPQTWIGSPREISACVADQHFPLVIKPVFGDNGAGISLLNSRQELLQQDARPVLAQQYINNDGFDLKLYCIGEQVFAVRKACSVASLHTASRIVAPELVPLSPELARIANQCRLCFGLELFGVDCVLGPDGPSVIEVNEFPNYSAVPGASELLANYVCNRAAVRC